MGNFTLDGEVRNREQAYQELTGIVEGRKYNLGELVLRDGKLERVNNHAKSFLWFHRNDTKTTREDNQLVRRAVYNLLKTQYPDVEADAAKKELFEEISERLIGKGYSYLPLTRREACGYLQMLSGRYAQINKTRIDFVKGSLEEFKNSANDRTKPIEEQADARRKAAVQQEHLRHMSFELVDELFRNEHGIDEEGRKIGGLSRERLEDVSRSKNIQLDDWRKVSPEVAFSAAIKEAGNSGDKVRENELQDLIWQAESLKPAELAQKIDALMKKRKDLNDKFSLLKGDWKPDVEKFRAEKKKGNQAAQREETVRSLRGVQSTYRHDAQLHEDVKTVLESLKEMLAKDYPEDATVLLGANPNKIKFGEKTYVFVKPLPPKEGEPEQKIGADELLVNLDNDDKSFEVVVDGQTRTVIRACKIDITEEQVRTWLGNREDLDAGEVLRVVNDQLGRNEMEIDGVIRSCEDEAALCRSGLEETTEKLRKAEIGGGDEAEAGGDGQQDLSLAINAAETRRTAVQKRLDETSKKIFEAWRKSAENSQQGNAPGEPGADKNQGGPVRHEAVRKDKNEICSLSIDEANAKMEELERELNEVTEEVDQALADLESLEKLPDWRKELSDLEQGVTEELKQKLMNRTFGLLVEREKVLSSSLEYHEDRMTPVAAMLYVKAWNANVHDFTTFKDAMWAKIIDDKASAALGEMAEEITLEGDKGTTVTMDRKTVMVLLRGMLEQRVIAIIEETKADVLKGLDQWFAAGQNTDELEAFLGQMATAVEKKLQSAMRLARESKSTERTGFLWDVRKTIADKMNAQGALRNEVNQNRLDRLFGGEANEVSPGMKTGAGGPPGRDFFNMIKSGGKYKDQELAEYISNFNARGLKSNGSDVQIDEAMVRSLDESFVSNAQKELAQIRMTAEMIGIDWEWLEPHMDLGIGVFVSYSTMLQTALMDVAGKIDETLAKPPDKAKLADHRKALLDAHKLLSARKAMFGRMKRVRGLIKQANSVNQDEDGQKQTELEKAINGFAQANVNSPIRGEGVGFFAKLFASKASKEDQKKSEFYNEGFIDSVGRQLVGNMANRLVRFANVQFEALEKGISGLYTDVNPENKIELADEDNPEDGVVQEDPAMTEEDSRWKELNAEINRFNALVSDIQDEKVRDRLQIKPEDLQAPETWKHAEKWQQYQQDVPSFVQQQFYMGMDGDVADFSGLEKELVDLDISRKVSSKDVDSYKLKPLYYVINPELKKKEEPNGI